MPRPKILCIDDEASPRESLRYILKDRYQVATAVDGKTGLETLQTQGPFDLVLLELGQPMHAYDLAKLEGRIEARLAKAGEKIVLLDGREIALEDDVLVIADTAGPVGMAGIFGDFEQGFIRR